MGRRLAAILAVEVVGFSRLMDSDEAGTSVRLKALRRDSVQPKIRAGGGRIVKLMGDVILAEFASVVEAVRCAAELRRAMPAREPERTPDRLIRRRIGIDLGDVIVEGADIDGGLVAKSGKRW